MLKLEKFIRDIPDFPKKGIIFKDITPLIGDPLAFQTVINLLAKKYQSKKIDKILCVESRGFIFASALSYKLGIGIVPVRKPGKLPYKTTKETYALEYGTDTLEMHIDAFKKGARVLIIDDLLATGGTVQACTNLVKKLGGKVAGIGFVIELSFLHGRDKLKGFDIYSIIKF
ncbi:MAG: adenine phosphoribosyltransferase [bacterium]|nr:adenine phosphoribosyltransferase [bacterium]MDD5756286.1 adenine phosphoribosyltransferase [bacterium]